MKTYESPKYEFWKRKAPPLIINTKLGSVDTVGYRIITKIKEKQEFKNILENE